MLRNPVALWIGAVTTLICCFTPALVGLTTLVGLGAIAGYLDFALMPLLGFFITGLALVHGRSTDGRLAWAIAAASLAALAIFFGRFNPTFAALIAIGAVVAVLANYRKAREDNE